MLVGFYLLRNAACTCSALPPNPETHATLTDPTDKDKMNQTGDFGPGLEGGF